MTTRGGFIEASEKIVDAIAMAHKNFLAEFIARSKLDERKKKELTRTFDDYADAVQVSIAIRRMIPVNINVFRQIHDKSLELLKDPQVRAGFDKLNKILMPNMFFDANSAEKNIRTGLKTGYRQAYYDFHIRDPATFTEDDFRLSTVRKAYYLKFAALLDEEKGRELSEMARTAFLECDKKIRTLGEN